MAGWLVERSLRFTDDQDLQLGELEGKMAESPETFKFGKSARLLREYIGKARRLLGEDEAA